MSQTIQFSGLCPHASPVIVTEGSGGEMFHEHLFLGCDSLAIFPMIHHLNFKEKHVHFQIFEILAIIFL